MNSNDKNLIRTLFGEKTSPLPFWFMRQAGRYLPEYRELRNKTKNFLEFCYTPELAIEVTLQPIRRFAMDAAIIFSDILVVPHALGMEVWFEEGHGPRLTPIRDKKSLEKLQPDMMVEKLQPVYEALKGTKTDLPKETALIGFIGAPWTLATYVVEGKSGSDFSIVKSLAKEDKKLFSLLVDILTNAVIVHALEQIKSGAEVIQVFDSWAGVLTNGEYEEWVITPAKKIVSELKKQAPQVPIICFPRQSGAKFLSYAQEVKSHAVSVDNSVPLEWISAKLQPLVVVQGNLDPALLAGDKKPLLEEAAKICAALADKPFVFNLGHGILPHTPVENMQALCEFLKTA